MTATPEMREIEINKGRHRIIVRYEVGEEAAVESHLSEMVSRPAPLIDWMDAAMLANQMKRETE